MLSTKTTKRFLIFIDIQNIPIIIIINKAHVKIIIINRLCSPWKLKVKLRQNYDSVIVNYIFISYISTWILAVQWPFHCVMILNFVRQEDLSWNLEWRLMYSDFEMFQSIKVQCFAEPTVLVDLSNFSYYISVVSILHHTTEPPKRANFLFGGAKNFLFTDWLLRRFCGRSWLVRLGVLNIY